MSPSGKAALVVLFIFVVAMREYQCEDVPKSQGILDKLKDGLKMAGKIFGFDDISSGVAQLVATAFKNREKKYQNAEENVGMLSKVFNLLTMDVSKIGAVVVNAFVFLAQLIHLSVTKKLALPSPEESPRTSPPDGTPYEWITESRSSQLQDLLKAARDEHLADRVIESIRNRSKTNTECVQLLVCRMTPFVKGMQRALKEREEGILGDDGVNREGGMNLNIDALFKYLPGFEEFKSYGEECKKRHGDCSYALDD